MNDSIKGNFIFDTGAYGFVIDSAFASKKITKASLYDSFGDPLIYANFMRIKIDSLGFFPEYVEPMNCKKWNGRFIDGIVGWDLFKNKAIKVDYEHSKIIVLESEDLDLGSDFEKIPLTIKKGKMLFEASIELKDGRKIEGLYMLDLGCVASVVLVGRASRTFKLDSTLKEQFPFVMYDATLYNDTSFGATFRSRSIKVGSIEMKEPVIDYLNNKTGIVGDSTDYLGLIGNEYFVNFDMYIDFKEMFLYLKPNKKFTEVQEFKYLGFSTIDRSDIGKGRIVKGLTTNSDAVKFGIKYGDIVTHIDNRAVETFTLGEEIYKDKKKEYDFTFKRGDSLFHYKGKFRSN